MNTNDCDDLQRMLGPYLDSELDARTSLEISLHLKDCPACAARFATEAAWQRKLNATLNQGTPTEGLWEAIEERIRESDRRASAATNSKRADAAGQACLRNWRYWLWPSPRLYSGLAAAWAVIAMVQIGTQEPGRPGPSSPSETRTALAEQRHLLAELLGSPDPESERVGTPPPQTDARQPGGHEGDGTVRPRIVGIGARSATSAVRACLWTWTSRAWPLEPLNLPT